MADINSILNSSYMIMHSNRTIHFYDLYRGLHRILDKSNKTVGTDKFETTKLVLNYNDPVIAFIVDFCLRNPAQVQHEDEQFNDWLQNWIKENSIHSLDRKTLENMCVYGEAFEEGYIKKGSEEPKIRNILNTASYPYYGDDSQLDFFIESFKQYDWNNVEIQYSTMFERDKITPYRALLKEGEPSKLLAVKDEILQLRFGYPIFDYINRSIEGEPVSDLEVLESIINEIEEKLSNVGDVLDYNSSPTLISIGQRVEPTVKAKNTGNNSGRVLNMAQGSDVRYLTWDQNVSAVDWYINTLKSMIYELSLTPKIFFDSANVSNLSGVALTILYSVAIIKSTPKIENFKQGLMKRYGWLKQVYEFKTGRKVDGMPTITITPSIPMNESELISNLTVSVDAKLISRELAMTKHPYVTNVQEEQERIQGEEQSDPYGKQFDKEIQKEFEDKK